MLEEVGALQVSIALSIAGIDSGDVNRGLYAAEGSVYRVFDKRSAEAARNGIFTLEIIMCLTLNSALECAGSSFQVVLEVGTDVVDISIFSLVRLACLLLRGLNWVQLGNPTAMRSCLKFASHARSNRSISAASLTRPTDFELAFV